MGAATGTAGSLCGGQTLLLVGRIGRPMSPKVSAGWTEDRIDVVKTLWAQGKSASEIAKALGGGASRNAVIGKVHRLGLVHAGREIPAKPTVVRPPRAPKVKAQVRPKPPHPGPQKKPAVVFGATFLETPASDEQRAAFRKVGLTIVERVEQGCGVESPNARPFLEAKGGCKWPLAGGMVCCNRIARGVYCAGHAAVAYIDKPPTSAARGAIVSLVNRTERIDFEDSRYVHGKSGARPYRDAGQPSEWDSARAAA